MKHPELDTIPGMKQEREGAGKSYSCGSWQPTHQELQPVALVGKRSHGPNHRRQSVLNALTFFPATLRPIASASHQPSPTRSQTAKRPKDSVVEVSPLVHAAKWRRAESRSEGGQMTTMGWEVHAGAF